MRTGTHSLSVPSCAALRVQTTRDTFLIAVVTTAFVGFTAPARAQQKSEQTHPSAETKDLIAEGGQETEISLAMQPLSEGLVLKRRWKTWKPWAVAGAGVGLALLGGFTDRLARADYETYDAYVAEDCPRGCEKSLLSDRAKSIGRTADLESIASTSLLITGGGLVLSGGVLFFLNRERPTTPEPGSPSAMRRAPIRIVPLVGLETVGFSSEFRF